MRMDFEDWITEEKFRGPGLTVIDARTRSDEAVGCCTCFDPCRLNVKIESHCVIMPTKLSRSLPSPLVGIARWLHLKSKICHSDCNIHS